MAFSAEVALEITFNIDKTQAAQLETLFREFPKHAPRVVVRALNRAGEQALTSSKKAIAQELSIKQKDLVSDHAFGATGPRSVGQAIELFKATDDNLEACVHISGRRIPVVWFGAKPTDPSLFAGTKALRQRGVSWNLGYGRRFGREPTAFVALMPSGHKGVFKRVNDVSRKGGPRPSPPRPEEYADLVDEKLYELRGPSIPHVAEKNPALDKALNIDVTNTLQTRLDHEIERLLERLAKGGG